ncbi:hypothetical protein [Streptomyces lateritius]|uniref:hypothetical protein n=1 Tax=Streptomyces lateritius TaxID=67313 RepID=UPI001672816E|nr:hypothetical protein [Streptomyces lateritius]GGT99328.1 hypothetical protein GCM10010272_50080 [Streptomyces lateritius]
MTSTEYRARAEKLLTSKHPLDLSQSVIEQAAAWAQLATAAAIAEAAEKQSVAAPAVSV